MREGGSYVTKNGKLRKVAGTEPHPDGNRPRAADGTPLNTDQPKRPIKAKE